MGAGPGRLPWKPTFSIRHHLVLLLAETPTPTPPPGWTWTSGLCLRTHQEKQTVTSALIGRLDSEGLSLQLADDWLEELRSHR